MEQIQGTEALEREILEDAARKADKIKKKAEGDASRILAEAQSGIQKKIAVLQSEHEARIASLQNELRSRVPTEKSRLQSKFKESVLEAALKEFFEHEGSDLLGQWCLSQLEKNQKLIYASSADVFWKGLNAADQKKLEEFCGKSKSSLALHEDAGLPDRGVRVKPKDQSYECRFTERELRDWLLDNKRGMLADALFGSNLNENPQENERAGKGTGADSRPQDRA